MKLSELIAHIGDDNVFLQNLQSSFLRGSICSSDAEITFSTEKDRGQQLLDAGASGRKPDHVGLVLWLPRERLPEGMR